MGRRNAHAHGKRYLHGRNGHLRLAISLNNSNAVQGSIVTVGAGSSLLFNTNSGTITTYNVGGLAGSGNIALADGIYALTVSAGGNGGARPTAAP